MAEDNYSYGETVPRMQRIRQRVNDDTNAIIAQATFGILVGGGLSNQGLALLNAIAQPVFASYLASSATTTGSDLPDVAAPDSSDSDAVLPEPKASLVSDTPELPAPEVAMPTSEAEPYQGMAISVPNPGLLGFGNSIADVVQSKQASNYGRGSSESDAATEDVAPKQSAAEPVLVSLNEKPQPQSEPQESQPAPSPTAWDMGPWEPFDSSSSTPAGRQPNEESVEPKSPPVQGVDSSPILVGLSDKPQPQSETQVSQPSPSPTGESVPDLFGPIDPPNKPDLFGASNDIPAFNAANASSSIPDGQVNPSQPQGRPGTNIFAKGMKSLEDHLKRDAANTKKDQQKSTGMDNARRNHLENLKATGQQQLVDAAELRTKRTDDKSQRHARAQASAKALADQRNQRRTGLPQVNPQVQAQQNPQWISDQPMSGGGAVPGGSHGTDFDTGARVGFSQATSIRDFMARSMEAHEATASFASQTANRVRVAKDKILEAAR